MNSLLEGGCACGATRYALSRPPMIVHACHCRDCQRMTGSALAINVWVERASVDHREGALATYEHHGGSGALNIVSACEACGTHLWSKYCVGPSDSLWVRGGSLDDPGAVTPDVHIFTRSKLPWFVIPEGVPTYDAYYKTREVWSVESRARLRAIVPPR